MVKGSAGKYEKGSLQETQYLARDALGNIRKTLAAAYENSKHASGDEFNKINNCISAIHTMIGKDILLIKTSARAIAINVACFAQEVDGKNLGRHMAAINLNLRDAGIEEVTSIDLQTTTPPLPTREAPVKPQAAAAQPPANIPAPAIIPPPTTASYNPISVTISHPTINKSKQAEVRPAAVDSNSTPAANASIAKLIKSGAVEIHKVAEDARKNLRHVDKSDNGAAASIAASEMKAARNQKRGVE